MNSKSRNICKTCGDSFSPVDIKVGSFDLNKPDQCYKCQFFKEQDHMIFWDKVMGRAVAVIIVILFVAAGVFISKSEAHTPNFCNIWLATYTQYHPDNKDISIKQTEFELILKKMGLYNIQEIEVALDSDDMLYAADKGIETDKILKDCNEMVNKFLEEK